MNTGLIVIMAILVVVLVLFVFRKRTGDEETDELIYSLDELVGFAENYIEEEVATNNLNGNDKEFQKRKERKNELREALTTCFLGDRPNKLYVKSFLRDGMMKVYDFTDENLEKVIPFNKPERLTHKEKFDILLYHFGKTHRLEAFSEIMKKYNLNRLRDLHYIPKRNEQDKVRRGYAVTREDVDSIFAMENIELTTSDKIEIVVQRVYEIFKGLGVIDEIRDMNIDGVRGGTSGIPGEIAYAIDVEGYDTEASYIPRAHDSVMIFYKGISLHMEFLSFGSEAELRRVCQTIYTFDSPGQMDQQTGHKINEMADQSRVVVVGPKFADSWAFFVRKFDGGMASLYDLWKDENSDMLIEWVDFVAKGAVTTALTGQQGTGKTLGMKAAVDMIYHYHTLRTQEGSSFELWLRRSDPYRDSLAFRETSKMSGADGLVVQKKTDGAINLVGEVADDHVFSWVMKAAQVASLCTWFTHHAQTARALVNAARDALVTTGQMPDARMAEEYVSSVLKQNIHLVNVRGKRYCERVTEYIPLTDTIEYDESFLDYVETDPIKSMAMFNKVRYQKILKDGMPLYKTQNIIEFRDGKYVAVNKPTDSLVTRMKRNMEPEDAERLDNFIKKHWGEEAA